MSDADLWDALSALHAYDMGATDSGIHDERLRERVKETLRQMDPTVRLAFLARGIRDHMLSEEALQQGYGVADVEEFLEWVQSEMGIAI